MTEYFTAIKTEVLINGVWVDLTPDVMTSPSPKVSGIGIMGNGILDRVGDAGTYTFSLKNGTNNSAGVLGYYNPLNAGGLFGWRQGLPVHLYFEYDGHRRYKFYGTIDPDGIEVIAGKYGERRVNVKCTNWMGLAARHQLNLMEYQINLTYDTAIPYIIQNMGEQPQNTYFNPGVETFPTVFDTTRSGTKSLGEFQKLMMSEFGRLYIMGDNTNGEKLYGENRTYRSDHSTELANAGDPIPVKMSLVTDNLLLMTGDDLLLMQSGNLLLNNSEPANFLESDLLADSWRVSYAKNFANRVTMRTFPRTVDAAATTVLFSISTDNAIELLAGEQLTDFRGRYTDPDNPGTTVNGIDSTMTTNYAAFENADGTGTNYTSSVSVVAEYGTSEVSYTITNNAAATVYITTLEAVGKGVYIYEPNDKVYISNSVTAYAKTIVPMTIELPYLGTVTNLFDYETGSWNDFLIGMEIPELTLDQIGIMANSSSKNMFAFMYIEPNMEITMTETVTGLLDNHPHYVNGYDFEIISGKFVKWTPVMKSFGRY